MQITFGIISHDDRYVDEIIESIKAEKIPEYEVLIVGGSRKHEAIPIAWDETKYPNKIGRKKNLITQYAKYENIVYMHDYVQLLPGWYEGWKDKDFKVGMNIILDYHGRRYRDWSLWYVDVIKNMPLDEETRREITSYQGYLIPYDLNLSKWQYISGAYWIAKKHVMNEFPMNPDLGWSEGEDVEWSERVRAKYQFTMNTDSTVQLMKQEKIAIFHVTAEKHVQALRKL